MKKLIFPIIAMCLMFSCTPKVYMNSYSVDLSKHYASGMFITESNSVAFDYEPIGLVGIEGGGKEYKESKVVKLTLDDVFNQFVDNCKKLGANAVINIKIEQIHNTGGNTYYISGMAVKKK
ncbi:hypothetical protein [Dysgonomonas sp. GY617]|uniref:hypothetical protein n=1 Tax=Dysgonomonas sp. GY617 TaxID=2780420 RepID=UPI0018841F5B|nr:hypothetical protein [Dysgonomonas sp. GY617]MBF0577700.1 hypothetical protein [Dysgonomonas sp. GY617]